MFPARGGCCSLTYEKLHALRSKLKPALDSGPMRGSYYLALAFELPMVVFIFLKPGCAGGRLIGVGLI